MFEAWARPVPGEAADACDRCPLRGGRRDLGNQRVGKLTSGDTFTPPGSQSSQESNLAASVFGRDAADVVVVYRSSDAHRRRPGVPGGRRGRALASVPPGDLTQDVTSYWTYRVRPAWSPPTGTPRMRAAVGREPGITAGGTHRAIKAALGGRDCDGITAQVGGYTATEVAINDAVGANIARAESISFPVLLILLVIIFGGVVAATAPLLLGGLAILGAFTVLRLVTWPPRSLSTRRTSPRSWASVSASTTVSSSSPGSARNSAAKGMWS